jgi:hypothetical protein
MNLSQFRWGRIVVAALLAIVLTYVAVFVVVSGYGFKLGFEARGTPDQEQIRAFAQRIGPRLGTPLLALFTLVGAWWATRRAGATALAQGLAVGLLVVIVGLVMTRQVSLVGIASNLLILVAGAAGGWLGSRGGAAGPPPVR